MSLRVPFCLVVFGNVVAQDMAGEEFIWYMYQRLRSRGLECLRLTMSRR